MLAYTNTEHTSISEYRDNRHCEEIELGIGEWNYIMNSDIEEVKDLILKIVEKGEK